MRPKKLGPKNLTIANNQRVTSREFEYLTYKWCLREMKQSIDSTVSRKDN